MKKSLIFALFIILLTSCGSSYKEEFDPLVYQTGPVINTNIDDDFERCAYFIYKPTKELSFIFSYDRLGSEGYKYILEQYKGYIIKKHNITKEIKDWECYVNKDSDIKNVFFEPIYQE